MSDNYGFRCNCGDPLCRAQLLEDYTGEELTEALSMVHLCFQGRNVIGAIGGPSDFKALLERYLTPDQLAEVIKAVQTEPWRFRGLKVMESREGAMEFHRRATEVLN